MDKLPKWADILLVPLISLLLAALVSALVLLAIGQSPMQALTVMVNGAIVSPYGWGYTLYYATSFIFTGLAVSVAYHAGLFNIGAEGQAQLGGLGVALACLFLPWPHWSLALVGAMVGAALFGAAWAAIPAWLQAKRGSHIVITTIMFNYIAAAVLIYLLVEVLRPAGQMDPASARFPATTSLPQFQDIPGLQSLFLRYAADGTVRLNAEGLPLYQKVPANVTFFLAILACVGVWVMLWHTRLGYMIRAFGKSEKAARYAGISAVKITMTVMLISGALAGLMAINNVMGQSERLLQNSAEGRVSSDRRGADGAQPSGGGVSGRDPVRFPLSGGAALGLETAIPIELRTVVQGLVILFTGALDQMVRMMLGWAFRARRTV
ncbi:ABC transporter permease [Gemmobacter lanyuensis]